MHIDSYSFGHISVAGETYTSDVIIFPDRVLSSWRRRHGHRLEPEDLSEALACHPDSIIIGTGKSGLMKVPAGTIEFLEQKGIRLCLLKTEAAVELMNSLPKCQTIVAALHLTC